MQLNVLVLPGDGIGTEVTREAVRVLRHVADPFGHTVNLTGPPADGALPRQLGTTLPFTSALLR